VTLPRRLRKLVLAVHLAVSVGWLGAIAAYVPLDVVAATSADATVLRSAYLGMDAIVRYAIVPLALAALLTGVMISVTTRWGLFRHWWVVISFLLTTFATVVLLIETSTISSLAAVAADPASSADRLRSLGDTLFHSLGGLTLLIVVLVLNVYKPTGLTAYGWRKQREDRLAAQRRHADEQRLLVS
jgi:hypothetical protein